MISNKTLNYQNFKYGNITINIHDIYVGVTVYFQSMVKAYLSLVCIAQLYVRFVIVIIHINKVILLNTRYKFQSKHSAYNKLSFQCLKKGTLCYFVFKLHGAD